jgi:signal transduction histidine kinase
VVFGSTALWTARASRIDAGRGILRSWTVRTAESLEPAPWSEVESDLRRSLDAHADGAALAWVLDGRGLPGGRTEPWIEGLPVPAQPAGFDGFRLPGPFHPPPARDRPAGPKDPDPSRGPPPPFADRVVGSADTVVEAGGRRWAVCLAKSRHRSVVAAWDLGQVRSEMEGMENAFLLALPAALLLVALGAWFLSARAVRPISLLSESLREVGAQGLDRRIARFPGDGEFDELVDGINAMLGRLERGFLQARRFSADAAHELRTPLTIIQGQVERVLDAAEAGSTLQVGLSSVLDEVRRLSSIFGKLLLLSRADGGTLRPALEPYDVSEALEALVDDLRLLAPRLEIHAKCPAGLVVSADPTLMSQVLLNLGSNAIKYNVDRGWILVSAQALPDGVEICMANSSRGIDPADRERIFDRFYRSDPARNRSVEGVGLGLALAREISRAHGGELRADSKADGTVIFTLKLPGEPA